MSRTAESLTPETTQDGLRSTQTSRSPASRWRGQRDISHERSIQARGRTSSRPRLCGAPPGSPSCPSSDGLRRLRVPLHSRSCLRQRSRKLRRHPPVPRSTCQTTYRAPRCISSTSSPRMEPTGSSTRTEPSRTHCPDRAMACWPDRKPGLAHRHLSRGSRHHICAAAANRRAGYERQPVAALGHRRRPRRRRVQQPRQGVGGLLRRAQQLGLRGKPDPPCTNSARCTYKRSRPTTCAPVAMHPCSVGARINPATSRSASCTRFCTRSGSLHTGIVCPTTCTTTYQGSVTLRAAPSVGAVFKGWTGACNGTSNCVITGTTDVAVGANFAVTVQPKNPKPKMKTKRPPLCKKKQHSSKAHPCRSE